MSRSDGGADGGATGGAVVGRVLGPVLCAALLALPVGGLTGDARTVAAVTLWMAAWWVTEAVPLAVTALLPVVLLPLLGARAVGDVTPNYANHMIFLFLGGFVLALAVERSGLHKRIALTVLAAVGASPRRLVWGFLLATALLSMWLSNTATTLMMLPIVAGVANRLGDRRAGVRMLLGVAYGASVGGMGTLVGTPPNLVLAGMAPKLVEGLEPLTFGGWMLFGVPLVVCLIPIVGGILTLGLPRAGRSDPGLAAERASLGPVRREERRAAILFVVTALAWITRAGFDLGSVSIPGWSHLLVVLWGVEPRVVSDAVPAIAAAVAATLVPVGDGSGRRLLSWDEIRLGVPWGVLLLFGGGFALADAVRASGLDKWLAGVLTGLHALPLPLIVLTVCLITTFATELTSNTATATLLMPVMASLARVLGVPPYLLLVPAAVSASCAFMLPVATPPNAIVIGSGLLGARDLARFGLWLNLTCAVVIAAVVLTLGRLVLPLG